MSLCCLDFILDLVTFVTWIQTTGDYLLAIESLCPCICK